MSHSEQIRLLRAAVIGLMGQVEEYCENIGECYHALGTCRCRATERLVEARAALELTEAASKRNGTGKSR